MNKFALSLVSVFAVFATFSAQAAQVYYNQSGRWEIKGYIAGADTSCVISTSWPDGKRINVNVFPKSATRANVTMTVRNPSWDNSNWYVGFRFPVSVVFESGQYGTRYSKGSAQIYGDQKIIFRDLNATMAYNFVHFDTMTLFANSGDQLGVSLNGTAAIAESLKTCTAQVLGSYFSGFDNGIN